MWNIKDFKDILYNLAKRRIDIMGRVNFNKLVNMWLEDKKKYVKVSTYTTYNYIVNKYLLP